MSELVAAEARGAQDVSVVGMNPLGTVALAGGLLIGGLVGATWFLGTVAGGPVVLLPLLALLFVLFWTGGNILAALLNMRFWLAARAAVSRGDLVPGRVIRNGACTGIAMIDEGQERLYVNGITVPFSDVRRVTTEPAGKGFGKVPRLFFTVVHQGQTKRLGVGVDTDAMLQSEFDRLAVVLDLR